jgi:prolyl oligopeptidase
MLRPLVACFLLAGATAAGALSLSEPPVLEPRPVTDSFFGTAVDDPYRYMEDLRDPEVASWMRAQADYSRALLDLVPGRKALLERINALDIAVPARVINVQRRPGELYFYEKRGAKDNQFKLYVRQGRSGAERLLVDPEQLQKASGKPHAINYFVPSSSGRHVAYGISAGGSEDAELFVMEVATGRNVLGPVSRAQFGVSGWLADDSGLFFVRLQELKPGMAPIEKFQRTSAQFLPLAARDDRLAVAMNFESPGVRVNPGQDSPWVVPIPDTQLAAGFIYHGTARELSLYVAPLADAMAGRATWRPVFVQADDVTGVEIVGDRLFVLTHRGASRFRVLETSLAKPDLAQAREVMPQGAGVITGFARAADGLYVTRRDGTVSRLFRVGFARGARPVEIKLPLAGSFDLAGVDHRLPGVLMTLQGWTRGPQIYAVRDGQVTNTALQPRGKVDALADYVATEVLVPSHDGARVPLSIIHKRGLKLDGNNPTLLYGYASYGITEEPWFTAWRMAWLERGGVFAVANPRGSGAFGQDWYKGGFQATKPNTWRDFIATAEYLVSRKYTRPARLGIWGGSAGGILVGRAMTERPDLFGVVIPSVGVMDMVRAELTPNGVPNIPEFGTHTTEAGFRALLAMSTYHQIKDGTAYPAVLLTHGVNDPRVDVWHSTKAAARLLAASRSGKPVLLRLDYEAGHGIGNTREQRNAERADLLAFLFWQMGVPQFQRQELRAPR